LKSCTCVQLLGERLDVVEVFLLGKLGSDLINNGGQVSDVVLSLEGLLLVGDGVRERVLEGGLHTEHALVSLVLRETVDSLTDDIGLLTEDIVVTQTYDQERKGREQ
jgi:hypothetical protein